MTSNYNYAYFAHDANRWDSTTEAFWGLHDICPSLMQFCISGITRADLSPISQAGGWGNPKKQSQGMANLLLAPSQEAEEKRFGLVGVWVHPQPVYLSAQRRIGTMPLCMSMRMHSTSLFWCWTHQQLSRQSTPQKHLWEPQPTGGLPTPSLRWGGDIPRGLNGGLEPVQVTLPKLPLWEMGSTSEDTQLQITLPRTTKEDFSGSSPSMVIDTSFLPTLHYRVPQWSSHWS